MTLHLPVLPPSLKGPSETWAPRETFSPSQLTRFGGKDGCQRKWAFHYLFGVREVKTSKGRALGTLIHACLEQYLQGRTVYDLVAADGTLRVDQKTARELAEYDQAALQKLATEAPKRALAGLHLLPQLGDPALEVVEVEQQIQVDTRRIIGGVEPVSINGKRDLAVRRAGVWYLYDHKSTKGRRESGKPFDPWAYCATEEDLRSDPQGVFYALDLVYKHELDALWSRWVYYLTDDRAHPLARGVDVELLRPGLEREAYSWLIVAVEMRRMVRAAKAGTITIDDIPPPMRLPPDPASPCNAFGGCPYRAERGGPCLPNGPHNYGAMLLESAKNQAKETSEMSLAEQLAATRHLAAGQPAGATLTPPAAPAVQLPPAPAGYGWVHDPTTNQYVCVPQAQPAPVPVPVVPQLVPPEAHVLPPAPAPVNVAVHVAPGADAGAIAQSVAAAFEGAAVASDGETGSPGRPKGAKNKPKPTDLDKIAEAMKAGGVKRVAYHADGLIALVELV